MTPDPISISPDMSIVEAAILMIKSEVGFQKFRGCVSSAVIRSIGFQLWRRVK